MVVEPISGAGWVACALLGGALWLMATGTAGPDLTFSTLTAIYTALRFITPQQAAAGFGNTSLLSVMALFPVCEGISQTGGLERVMNKVLGSTSSVFMAQVRMMLPVMLASAFLNNTPIVALLIPILLTWSSRRGVSPKKLLMPLSYAAILGGTCTLIGTSTNLVISGLQQERYADDPSLSDAGIFDITKMGVAYAAWGFIYIILFGGWLPGAQGPSEQPEEELLLGLRVPKGSRHAGQSVSEVGLRGLEGLFLVSVCRTGKLIHAVGPDFSLKEDDICYFAGDLSQAASLGARFGLTLVTHETEESSRQGSLASPSLLPSPAATAKDTATEPAVTLGSVVAPGGRSGKSSNNTTELEAARREAGAVQERGGGGGGLPSAAAASGCVSEDPSCRQLLSSNHVTLVVTSEGTSREQHGSLQAVGAQRDLQGGLAPGRGHLLVTQGAGSSSPFPRPQAECRPGTAGPGGWRNRPPTKVDTRLHGGGREQQGGCRGLGEQPCSPGGQATTPRSGRGPSRLLQCKLKQGSSLASKSIRNAGFRGRFGAAVVALRRGKRRVEGRIGDIVLQPQDELVLDTGPGFSQSSPDVTDHFEDMEYIDSSGEKEYLSAFVIPKGSKLAGKSVHRAGLRGMPGLFLVYVDQADGTQLHAVAPEYVLQEGDTLWFAGGLQGVAFLLKMPGLRHIDEKHTMKTNIDILERRLVQVVVALYSPLIGKTPRECRFRSKYDAAIVAVQRRGGRLKQKIGDIILKGGDVLLLDTGPQFLSNYRDDKAFALVSEVEKSSPPTTSKMWIAMGLLLCMVSIQILQSFTHTGYEPFINLWTAALLTSSAMILTRCMSGKQARQSMDWKVYMCVASAFGVSQAIEGTHVAKSIGELFITFSSVIGGKVAILSGLYFCTSMLSEVLSNSAAAALMYPIGATAGDSLGVPPGLISAALMLGSSAAFMSPFGYQCNLMVYAAGNYKTAEFFKFGTGLKLWMWVAATALFALHAYLRMVCGVSIALALATAAGPLVWGWLRPFLAAKEGKAKTGRQSGLHEPLLSSA